MTEVLELKEELLQIKIIIMLYRRRRCISVCAVDARLYRITDAELRDDLIYSTLHTWITNDVFRQKNYEG